MENIFNYKIVTNGDMSSSITSQDVDLSKAVGYAIYAKWTGATAAGTIKIMVAVNEYDFVDLKDSEQIVAGASDFMWNVRDVFYDKVKVVFTRSGGTGILNVQINGKGDERS